jgi:hypothetical protein
MSPEEFLSTFEKRGFRILMQDGLRVEPFAKLTPEDRAGIAKIAADQAARAALTRLLAERERHRHLEREVRELKPADEAMLNQVRERLAAKLIDIRAPEPRRPRTHNWPLPTNEAQLPKSTESTDHQEEEPMQPTTDRILLSNQSDPPADKPPDADALVSEEDQENLCLMMRESGYLARDYEKVIRELTGRDSPAEVRQSDLAGLCSALELQAFDRRYRGNFATLGNDLKLLLMQGHRARLARIAAFLKRVQETKTEN